MDTLHILYNALPIPNIRSYWNGCMHSYNVSNASLWVLSGNKAVKEYLTSLYSALHINHRHLSQICDTLHAAIQLMCNLADPVIHAELPKQDLIGGIMDNLH